MPFTYLQIGIHHRQKAELFLNALYRKSILMHSRHKSVLGEVQLQTRQNQDQIQTQQLQTYNVHQSFAMILAKPRSDSNPIVTNIQCSPILSNDRGKTGTRLNTQTLPIQSNVHLLLLNTSPFFHSFFQMIRVLAVLASRIFLNLKRKLTTAQSTHIISEYEDCFPYNSFGQYTLALLGIEQRCGKFKKKKNIANPIK